jgi:phospholipid/cholesterol/gamma-HCH transport system ATP-binding protein
MLPCKTLSTPGKFGIQVEGLTKSFGAQRIWEDVTMEIPAGEVSVLLGPSGTGKSVFLK